MLFYKTRFTLVLPWSNLSQASAFNMHFYLDTGLVSALHLYRTDSS